MDRGQLGSGAEPGALARAAGRRGVGVPGLAARLVRTVAARQPGHAGDAGAGRCGRARPGRRGRRGAGRAGPHRARQRAAQGTVHQAHRHRRNHLVPAVQRAGRGLGPGRADHPGRAGRRRVAGDRAEGLVDRSRDRGLRAPAGPHRCQCAQAPGHHLLRAADAAAGCRGAPAAADERALLVQRGVPGPGQGPGRTRDRRAGRRLDGRAVDPRPRAPPRRITARPGAARGDRAGLAGGDRGADRGQRAAQVVSAASGRPDLVTGRAIAHGLGGDPLVRQEIARLVELAWSARWTAERAAAARAAADRPGRKARWASWPAASSPGRRRGCTR